MERLKMASKATTLDTTIEALAEAVPDSIKHLRAFLAYEEGPNGQKKYASGGAMVGYFVLGGGGLTAIAVVIGIVIRVIVSAVRD